MNMNLIILFSIIVGACLGTIVAQHSTIRKYEKAVREHISVQRKLLERLNNIFEALQSKEPWE